MKPLLLLLPVALAAQYRIVYPLSVVPGGIDAQAVNEHITKYEDLYHSASLRRGRFHLQYAMAGITGWTEGAKNLNNGTSCFVNGHGDIKLARCGNGISKEDRLPHLTAPLPPDKELETPRIVDITPPEMIPPHLPLIAHLLPPDLPIFVNRPDAPPEFPDAIPPITLRPNSPAPYWVPPVGISPGLFMPIPASTVPEPSYKWLLIGLALCAVVVLWWSRTNPKDKD